MEAQPSLIRKIAKYKQYLVHAANERDLVRKSGEFGETLEVDNPDGSLGSK